MRVREVLLLAAILPVIYPSHAAPRQSNQYPSTRIEALTEAAEKGDAKSQCELAKTYLESRNAGEAAKWFQKAAEQGLAEAQGWIGALHDAGLGASRDYIEASKWYLKAAEKGDVSAQVNLGFMYHQGRNNPQPVLGLNGELFVWTNDVGGVVLQDYAKAAKWYLKAAEQGSSFAQTSLGWMYLQGKGVKKDGTEATRWLLKAAEQGETSVQCILGALYVEGKAVPPDHVQAHRWLNLCATAMRGKKREIATKLLDELAGQMNPQQIEESRRLRSKPNPELGQTEGNEPYVIGMGVTSPVILIDPKPTYTEQARRVRAEGIVLAQCIVRKDGTVGSCKILRELGFGLDESAVSTISARWRFKPAFFQAKPVDCLVLIETSFRLY